MHERPRGMLFNSLHYLLFLPVVVFVFFALPARARALFLVLASCYFYMAFRPEYILILFLVIGIDYWSGIYIERSAGRRKRLGLFLSIASNLGILFVFKYYGFAAANVAGLSSVFGRAFVPPALDLVLPIGLSFHTFQSLAYIIEVFHGRFPAERNLGRFALYVLFFPQMVAGPIERPQGLLRQLQRLDQPFSYEAAVDGLRLILIGFWCKLLVADNLAPFVDATYGDAAHATGVTALLATLCFSLQIYCDFYGYSLIAIGSARMLGITLAPNFNHPYAATSVKDFWRRWHISLSTWFRDYVYLPLGGSRGGPWKRDRNLIIVFLLSGLWHGANWTFVAWGAAHALLVMIDNQLIDDDLKDGEPAVVSVRRRRLSVAGTFMTVSLAWVFFRASSLTDAFTLLGAMASKWSTAGADLMGVAARLFTYRSLVNDALVGLMAYGALTLFIEPISARGWPRSPRAVHWSLYYAMIASILVFARFESRSFIYFQF